MKAKHRTHPYRDGETKCRFCEVAIFTWKCCHSKERQKKLGWDTFLLEIGDLTKSALFGWAYPPPLKYSSMILVPREAQNLLQTRFFYMLISFSMCLFESGERKAPNPPLEGRGNKVTILLGRHFHLGMLPFERASKKTWLGHIFVRNWRPNQKCTF